MKGKTMRNGINKRVSSGTLILKALLNKGKMKSVEMRQIAFDNRTKHSEYSDGTRMVGSKVPNGWWCDGVSDLAQGGMIERLDDGSYKLTQRGFSNIEKPFTKKPILTHKEYTEEINDLRERWRSSWSKYNCLEWENRKLQEENQKLQEGNDLLANELQSYHKKEEIDYLDELINYGDDVEEGILERIKSRLK